MLITTLILSQLHSLLIVAIWLILFLQDLLQQPVMLILNLEATQRGIKSKSIQELKVLGDIPDKHGEELNAATDLTEFSDKNRLKYLSTFSMLYSQKKMEK